MRAEATLFLVGVLLGRGPPMPTFFLLPLPTPHSGDRFVSVLLPLGLVAASFAMLAPGAATMYTQPGKNA